MNSITLPLVDNTLLIDNTSLEHFVTCPRSAEYSLCRKRKPAGERSALRFGQIIHKVLETRYRSATAMHAQSPEVEATMIACAEAEFSQWTPPEDDFRTFSTATSFIREYGLLYPFEPFEIVKFPDGRPFIEVPFAIPLGSVGDIKVLWTGRIDLAYTLNGSLYLMDHKTTSVMGPSYFASFELASQLHGYAFAVEAMLGARVSGVVINALGIRKPTRTGRAFELARQLVPIQRGLLAEWRTDTLHLVADFLESGRRGYFPKATAWCVGKFGECPYRKVCTLETPEQREVMLTSGEFQDNDWSPLK